MDDRDREKRLRWDRRSLALLSIAIFFTAVILFDGIPHLRGPAPDTSEWHWVYQLRPLSRWSLPILMATVHGAAIWLFLTTTSIKWRRWVLCLLVLTHVGLQIGIVSADIARPWRTIPEATTAELIDRTLSARASGYFWTAAHITDIHATLRDYPAVMPTFDSEHARTHPPGIPLLNWLTIHALSDIDIDIDTDILSLRCTDLWLYERGTGTALAILIWALLPMIAAALTIPAVDTLVGRFDPQRNKSVAALTATIPALLLFAPKVDQFFPLLLILSLILLTLERPIHAYLAGLLLSIATFMSIGNVVMAVPVGIFLLVTRVMFGTRRFVLDNILFALGCLTVWLIYWLGYGVPPWEIIRTALDQHYTLVTLKRPYIPWLISNLVDLILFTGIPLILLLPLALKRSLRDSTGWVLMLTIPTIILIILLDLSGSTRGEVGRIWMFLMPLLILPIQLKRRDTSWLVLAQLLLVLAMGLAWRPVRPVIVVQQPPLNPPQREGGFRSPSLREGLGEGDHVNFATLSTHTTTQTNTQLTISLQWNAHHATPYPYTTFIHITDDTGTLVAQRDQWSMDGQWPPSCWRDGDVWHDQFMLDVGELPAGIYNIIVGMYAAETGERPFDPITLTSFER